MMRDPASRKAGGISCIGYGKKEGKTIEEQGVVIRVVMRRVVERGETGKRGGDGTKGGENPPL